MDIAGLPLHPLIVHAAVVLIPLSAVLAAFFALAPRWRWLTRWPTAALSVAVVGVAFVATSSGEALEESPSVQVDQAIHEHAERGDLLAWLLVAFAVVVLLGAWSLSGTTGLASGKGHWESRMPALERVMPAAIVLGALAVMVMVVLVGDSGARAVWAANS